MPVVVENDANSAAWAEARFGAARDHSDVVMLTIGTGVGGGIVIENRLFRGRFGIGAEIGLHRRSPTAAGAVAAIAVATSSTPAAAPSSMKLGSWLKAHPRWQVGSSSWAVATPEGIEGEEVTLAAQEGNAAARECFDIVGSYLGQLMADLAAVLDPGCFVLGGGVSESGDLLLLPARHAFQASLTGRGHRPVAEVRIAHLGGEAGIVGAADLARQH